MNQDESILKGETIHYIRIDDDAENIMFILSGGDIVLGHVYADCCSYSWIESIELPKTLYAKVIGIETVTTRP